MQAHPRLRLLLFAGAITPRGDEGGFHPTLVTLWAGLCPSHGEKGRNRCHQAVASIPAQTVHTAGTAFSAVAHRLFQHGLLTLIIPLFSPARPAVPLPGGVPEPANCISELCVSLHHRGVFLWGCFGDCWPLGWGSEQQHYLPFPLHHLHLNYLNP